MVEIIFDETEDWENRTLCSDGSCIGTIGPDGLCKECGKPDEGVLKFIPAEGVVPLDLETISDEMTNLPQNQEICKDNTSGDLIADEEWEKRILCSDGCCIGTIGPDGKCKECGKPLT
jgi:hypothetical protein